MLRLALVFGGRSAEHEISLASARFVLGALDPGRFAVTAVGIARDGTWVVPTDAQRALRDGLESVPCEPAWLLTDPRRPGLQVGAGERFIPLDFVFPVLHGPFGEDGTIQGLLEMAGLPYAGASVLGSAVGMDKELMKAAFTKWGLPQVDYVVLRDVAGAGDDDVARIEETLGYPVFVKPVNLGSSVGMTKAHDRAELLAAVDLALRYDRKVIVEAYAAGRELECSVLGNEEPRASLPGEIVPGNEYYDFEAKYTEGKMAMRIPAPLAARQEQRVRELAVQAFMAIDCCGYARCDFFVAEPDGRVIVNEINTIPGMTAMSAFPLLWEASGVSNRELVAHIVELGLQRHERRRKLMTTRLG